MALIERLSSYLTTRIREQDHQQTEEQLEVIQYGLSGLISSLVKVAIILGAAVLCGQFPNVLVAMVSFGLIRSLSGGVHASDFYSCLLSSAAAYVISILLAYRLPDFAWPLAALSAGAYLLYAPADVQNRPVRGKLRHRMRIASLVTVTAYLCAGLILRGIAVRIVLFSLIVQAATLLPITYRLLRVKGGEAYEAS